VEVTGNVTCAGKPIQLREHVQSGSLLEVGPGALIRF